MKYATFLRSCTNWREFASAPKIIQEIDLSYNEARDACEHYNANRSEIEKANGTKLEFTEQDNFDYRELAEFEENN